MSKLTTVAVSLCLAVAADGKRLAAGGCDRAVRVWDLSDGLAKAKLEQTIENHADWVLGVTLSADGKYLATAARDKTAKVWDLKAKAAGVEQVAFDRAGFRYHGRVKALAEAAREAGLKF